MTKRKTSRTFFHTGIAQALLAAVPFGAGTPLAKSLVGTTSPLILAGLLYLGSGLGLFGWQFLRRLRAAPVTEAPLTIPDLPWLAGGRGDCRRDARPRPAHVGIDLGVRRERNRYC